MMNVECRFNRNIYCTTCLLQGIEALEFWLDPPDSAPTPASDSPPPAAHDPDQDPRQPKVFCQKGKCYPYDPARMKNQNINLEMKPGKPRLPNPLLNLPHCHQE